MQAKRIPIDAIGIPGHWLLDGPPPLTATGLEITIAEMNIDPLPRGTSGADMRQTESGTDPYCGGLPPEIQAKLAARYGAVVGEIVRHPEATFLGFWGTYDGRSRLNDFPAKGRTNHPLLFDRNLRDKPAPGHVIRALARRPTPARPQEATLPRETPTSLAGRSQLQLR